MRLPPWLLAVPALFALTTSTKPRDLSKSTQSPIIPASQTDGATRPEELKVALEDAFGWLAKNLLVLYVATEHQDTEKAERKMLDALNLLSHMTATAKQMEVTSGDIEDDDLKGRLELWRTMMEVLLLQKGSMRFEDVTGTLLLLATVDEDPESSAPRKVQGLLAKVRKKLKGKTKRKNAPPGADKQFREVVRNFRERLIDNLRKDLLLRSSEDLRVLYPILKGASQNLKNSEAKILVASQKKFFTDLLELVVRLKHLDQLRRMKGKIRAVKEVLKAIQEYAGGKDAPEKLLEVIRKFEAEVGSVRLSDVESYDLSERKTDLALEAFRNIMLSENPRGMETAIEKLQAATTAMKELSSQPVGEDKARTVEAYLTDVIHARNALELWKLYDLPPTSSVTSFALDGEAVIGKIRSEAPDPTSYRPLLFEDLGETVIVADNYLAKFRRVRPVDTSVLQGGIAGWPNDHLWDLWGLKDGEPVTSSNKQLWDKSHEERFREDLEKKAKMVMREIRPDPLIWEQLPRWMRKFPQTKVNMQMKNLLSPEEIHQRKLREQLAKIINGRPINEVVNEKGTPRASYVDLSGSDDAKTNPKANAALSALGALDSYFSSIPGGIPEAEQRADELRRANRGLIQELRKADQYEDQRVDLVLSLLDGVVRDGKVTDLVWMAEEFAATLQSVKAIGGEHATQRKRSSGTSTPTGEEYVHDLIKARRAYVFYTVFHTLANDVVNKESFGSQPGEGVHMVLKEALAVENRVGYFRTPSSLPKDTLWVGKMNEDEVQKRELKFLHDLKTKLSDSWVSLLKLHPVGKALDEDQHKQEFERIQRKTVQDLQKPGPEGSNDPTRPKRTYVKDIGSIKFFPRIRSPKPESMTRDGVLPPIRKQSATNRPGHREIREDGEYSSSDSLDSIPVDGDRSGTSGRRSVASLEWDLDDGLGSFGKGSNGESDGQTRTSSRRRQRWSNRSRSHTFDKHSNAGSDKSEQRRRTSVSRSYSNDGSNARPGGSLDWSDASGNSDSHSDSSGGSSKKRQGYKRGPSRHSTSKRYGSRPWRKVHTK